jgi:hypothetical protein
MPSSINELQCIWLTPASGFNVLLSFPGTSAFEHNDLLAINFVALVSALSVTTIGYEKTGLGDFVQGLKDVSV